MHRSTTIFLLALLAGCATKPVVQLQQAKVPVACSEPVPERPAMPTEALSPPVTLDSFAKAAMAEIERREGYEQQLRTGLLACTALTNKKPL